MRVDGGRNARRGSIIGGVAGTLLVLGLLSRVAPPGYTRIELAEEGGGRKLLSAVVPDGERVILSWRNSQFGLHVTEVFYARGGELVQDQVTFSAPDGPPPPRVSPRDVDDLYHTGGTFDARGLSRPFRRIVFRIGEIGEPMIRVRNRSVAFQQAAGFGGRLILTTTRPALHEILWSREICPSRGPGSSGLRQYRRSAPPDSGPGVHAETVPAGSV